MGLGLCAHLASEIGVLFDDGFQVDLLESLDQKPDLVIRCLDHLLDDRGRPGIEEVLYPPHPVAARPDGEQTDEAVVHDGVVYQGDARLLTHQ